MTRARRRPVLYLCWDTREVTARDGAAHLSATLTNIGAARAHDVRVDIRIEALRNTPGGARRALAVNENGWWDASVLEPGDSGRFAIPLTTHSRTLVVVSRRRRFTGMRLKQAYSLAGADR